MNGETNGVEADRSPTLGALAASLAKAQGAMAGAKKDVANPFFKSKYADLASVWEACRDALSANQLAVIQLPSMVGKDVLVETLLLHSSGEWIRSRFAVPVTQPGPQGVGSATTYCRRYSLAAMVGVAPEDDDGNAATGKSPAEWGKESVLPATSPVAGKRTSEVKAQLSQRKIVEVRPGETEKEAEERSATHWFEKIRELGELHGLDRLALISRVKGAGIIKTAPEAFTKADFLAVSDSLEPPQRPQGAK